MRIHETVQLLMRIWRMDDYIGFTQIHLSVFKLGQKCVVFSWLTQSRLAKSTTSSIRLISTLTEWEQLGFVFHSKQPYSGRMGTTKLPPKVDLGASVSVEMHLQGSVICIGFSAWKMPFWFNQHVYVQRLMP